MPPSPIFGFDTLNFTQGKFTGHKLGVYHNKDSRIKSLLSRKITLNKFFVFKKSLRTTFLHSTSWGLLMKQRKYASLHFSKYTLVFLWRK